jgi:aryl-alcohol dehydrogenase (NADP+)
MTFGVETGEAEAHRQLDMFLAAGGTLVDTADVYGGGRSEEIIGRWFASRPAEVAGRVVLATKGRFPLDDAPNGSGLSARHLTRALDASLRRLGLDAVDLYQAHAFDPWTPLEETLRTLDGFVRAGKIRYWGLSNFTGWQLTKVVHVARAMNIAGPVTLQPQYSLLVREIEWEIVPAALDAGVGLLPWSPLGGGWLSGKYQRDERPAGATRLGEDPGRGMEAYDRRGTERTWWVVFKGSSIRQRLWSRVVAKGDTCGEAKSGGSSSMSDGPSCSCRRKGHPGSARCRSSLRRAPTSPAWALRWQSASWKDCPSKASCGSRSRARALPRAPGLPP